MHARPGPLRLAEGLFWRSYARALAGALIFAFPLLMTMEMWWFGMYMDRTRLALFLLLFLPALTGLSRYSGFRRTANWFDDFLDALVAVSAGLLVAVVLLWIFSILEPGMSIDEMLGKIALLCIPGSMGAIIASKNLGSEERNSQDQAATSYPGELFIMAAGAIFIAFNVAPTEEIILIAFKMSALQTGALVLLSILVLHALVYSLEFRGQHGPGGVSMLHVALSYSVAGYVIALGISPYVLWTFGRLEGLGTTKMITAIAVLGFPAALGAATARLII
jgi:putative integral membrane protein (TIGR02587 family)